MGGGINAYLILTTVAQQHPHEATRCVTRRNPECPTPQGARVVPHFPPIQLPTYPTSHLSNFPPIQPLQVPKDQVSHCPQGMGQLWRSVEPCSMLGRDSCHDASLSWRITELRRRQRLEAGLEDVEGAAVAIQMIPWG